ncbi:hypothetical protein F4821DRAFT_261115 [Hypoxylon rubiginosum]|uniref:Uncharacterized protein n=1 Tax=Hypoxylon rubiginosum TaxID=110542 RepID=A0ACC0CXT9_9PEZI|nr:hypothetical protein F4821DRAFT_261115 [Hypoxylon rubiginosum]
MVAEPLSMALTSLGVAGTVCNTVKGVWDVTKIVLELKDVPETSKVFWSILHQVNHDIVHAGNCYAEIKQHMKGRCIQVDWAVGVAEAAIYEVNKFGLEFKEIGLDVNEIGLDTNKIDTKYRFKFALREYKNFSDKEKSLRFAHSRLLTAIGTMHLMAFQLGHMIKSTSSPNPTAEMSLRRRASPALYVEDAENTDPALGPSGEVGGTEAVVVTAVEKSGV